MIAQYLLILLSSFSTKKTFLKLKSIINNKDFKRYLFILIN